jgi:hypothetical protein
MIHVISWRKQSDRLAQAAAVLNSQAMRDMLAVLELDHPSKNIPAIHDGFGATEQLGIIKGYERCLSMLRSMQEPAPIPPAAIHATWGSEQAK